MTFGNLGKLVPNGSYALLTLTMGLAACPAANAAPRTAARAATRTPARATSRATSRATTAGECSADFVNAVVKVVTEIKAVSAAVKAGEMPTNLPAAIAACDTVEKNFPGMSCQVNGQTVATADLANACDAIRDVAKTAGSGAGSGSEGATRHTQPTTPPPTASEIRDTTAVDNLAPSGVVVKIENQADFEKALSKPKLFFFIQGKLFDFASSITNAAAVRCTLAKPGASEGSAPAPLAAAVTNGQSLKSAGMDEIFQSDNFYTRVGLDGVDWTIDCSKHVAGHDGTTGITWGELKAAFGSEAEFSYAP